MNSSSSCRCYRQQSLPADSQGTKTNRQQSRKPASALCLLWGSQSQHQHASTASILGPHLYTMFCCPTPVGGAPDKLQWAHISKISEPQWDHILLCCPTPAERGTGASTKHLYIPCFVAPRQWGAPDKLQWAHISKISEPQWDHILLCCPTPAGRGTGASTKPL